MASSYVIRQGFIVKKNGTVYQGGDTVELEDSEFILHKHKLEGVNSTVKMIEYGDSIAMLQSSVNVETLTTDKTLTASDASYQFLTNTANAPLTLYLPASPSPNQRFFIFSNSSSTNTITITFSAVGFSASLLPGDRYEIVYDGIKWIPIDNWQYFGSYGEPHYFDVRSGRILSKQVSLDGFGANGSNLTGYSVRRYNGGALTPAFGMALPHGIVILEGSLTAQTSVANTLVNIEHYDMDGNNGQIVYTFPISHQANRMGHFTGTRIYIPPFRRLAFFINGSLSNFQGQYTYRKCFT